MTKNNVRLKGTYIKNFQHVLECKLLIQVSLSHRNTNLIIFKIRLWNDPYEFIINLLPPIRSIFLQPNSNSKVKKRRKFSKPAVFTININLIFKT